MFLLLFAVQTYAALDDTNMTICVDFDGNFSNILGDSTYEPYANAANTPTYLASGGLINGAYHFDGTDRLTIDRYMISGGRSTISVWVKANTSGGYEMIMWEGNNSDGMTLRKTSGNVINFAGAVDPTAWDFQTTETTNHAYNNVYHHIVAVRDGSNLTLYVNGTKVTSSTSSSSTGDIYFTGNAVDWRSFIGGGYGSVQKFVGRMDLFMVWDNRSLTSDEVSTLYNSGAGRACSYFLAGEPSIDVAANSPSDNYHTANTSINMSYTLTLVNSPSVSCTLMLNNTGTPYVHNRTTGISANGTYYFISTTMNETSYPWYVNCSYSTATGSSTPRTLVVDRTNPVFNFNHDNFFNTSSNSTIFQKFTDTNPARVNVTITDTYMFGYNITFKLENGDYFHTVQQTGLTSSVENVTFTVDHSNVNESQNITAVFYAEDDHTANEIPEYVVNKTPNALRFKTKTNNITISSNSFDTRSTNAEKRIDRYVFDFEKLMPSNRHSYNLSCDERLYYRGNLYPFPSFVCGKNWVDFNLSNNKDIVSSRVVMRGLQDAQITFVFKGNRRNIRFNSLGGLNSINQTFRYRLSVPQINGTLKDSSGTAVNNGQVFLVNQVTKDFQNTTTNSTGHWFFYINNTNQYYVACGFNPANATQGSDCSNNITGVYN